MDHCSPNTLILTDSHSQVTAIACALLSGGDAALAAAPVAAPAAASTKYDANDEVRVLNWQDREWRDRYWREMDLRKRR